MDRKEYIRQGRQSTNIRDLRRLTGPAWGGGARSQEELDLLNAITQSPSYNKRLGEANPAFRIGNPAYEAVYGSQALPDEDISAILTRLLMTR